MKTLNPPDKVIMQLIGRQAIKDDITYRPLKWTKKIYGNGLVLFHNFLTGETLEFEDDEEIERNHAYLVSSYFYVNEDSDDIRFTEEIRAALRLINKKKNITTFKILTTTACNARCAYCYESGIKWQHMALDTADRLIDYICEKSGEKKITLAWFGGEPLVNVEIIDYICLKIKERGKEFSSVMTSNGYLFTPELCTRAAYEWNLKNIQITLDGTHDNYNSIKNYVSVNDDPYERVLANIGMLTDLGVRVNIRLNMGLENYDDLLLLSDELHERFGDKDKVNVYASGLFQETEGEGDKSLLYERLDVLTKKLYEYGLASRSEKALRLRPSGCMADGDAHRGVSPAGDIMKCEHFIYEKTTGSIFEDNEDGEMLDFWKERLSYGEVCRECFALPTCYRLKNCPVSHICSPAERDQYLAGMESALRRRYMP